MYITHTHTIVLHIKRL